MPVVVIGVNHRTAPLDLLERLSVADGALDKTLHALLSRENLSEAVVLSTCNRTEVYAVAEKFHGGFGDVRAVLGDVSFLTPADFSDHLYVHHDVEAVRHLFKVTAGLDSAVLGEHEIQGQVKHAWEAAQSYGAVGPALNLLFRHALEAGKRARTETAIGRGTASVSYAAVALAGEHLGGLTGKRAVVLGTGDMGESMATSLADTGVADLVLVNRTYERAAELARTLGGRAVRFSGLHAELERADVLLTSTGASWVLLSHDEMAAVAERRGGRPLLLVDIAVPRDVEATVGSLPGITLLDMGDLTAFAEAGLAERRRELDAVRLVLDEELDRYRAATSARAATPAIVALRSSADAVRARELDRFRSKLASLDPGQLAAVEGLTEALVAKLLHAPTVALRDAAGTPKGDRLVQALRDLFDLDA